MIEDLERHPYPVDLSFFSPIARTARPYGHRASRDGSFGHDGDELGLPLFGGGVVLAFRGRWWRHASERDLLSFFDFLLVNEFDSERRNVLARGDRTLVPPSALDWWTGFGRRTVGGEDLFRNPAVRRNLILAAARVAPSFDYPSQERIGCRLFLYRALVTLKSLGRDVSLVLPPDAGSAPFEERLLSADMDRLLGEAKANEEARRSEAEVEWGALRGAADLLGSDGARSVEDLCPFAPQGDWSDPGMLYGSVRSLRATLR
jgi:hypothetical protein